MAATASIAAYLDKLLNTGGVADRSCNGLQVQGCQEVSRVGLAVDAALAVYQKAVEADCGMLLVHHGLIWTGITHVRGSHHRHLRYLLDHELNLYASHLPLDLHPRLGNNAVLARLLGLREIEPCFEYNGTIIGCRGRLPVAQSAARVAARLGASIGGRQLVLPFGKEKNRTVGIVSGAGADELPQAIAMGLDCFVTGEPKHNNHHQALEAGINVVYGGHYETETVGVRALGPILEKRFGVECVFLDVPTLV